MTVFFTFLTNSAGREAYGSRFYQPNRILVVVTEPLDEDKIVSPFTMLLTENVINVSIYLINLKSG